MSGTADIMVSGPCDGMGDPAPAGAYVQVRIATRGSETFHRISLGAAEVVAAEILGCLARPTPAREQDSREAWHRLYHEARGVAARMETENARLQAEVTQLRADLAEAENRAPTGLEVRGG